MQLPHSMAVVHVSSVHQDSSSTKVQPQIRVRRRTMPASTVNIGQISAMPMCIGMT